MYFDISEQHEKYLSIAPVYPSSYAERAKLVPYQLLQLCTAHTVLSDAVIRPLPFQSVPVNVLPGW